MERKAGDELAAEGISSADARFTRELDLRYTGQGYELRTPLEGLFADRLTDVALAAVRDGSLMTAVLLVAGLVGAAIWAATLVQDVPADEADIVYATQGPLAVRATSICALKVLASLVSGSFEASCRNHE